MRGQCPYDSVEESSEHVSDCGSDGAVMFFFYWQIDRGGGGREKLKDREK